MKNVINIDSPSEWTTYDSSNTRVRSEGERSGMTRAHKGPEGDERTDDDLDVHISHTDKTYTHCSIKEEVRGSWDGEAHADEGITEGELADGTPSMTIDLDIFEDTDREDGAHYRGFHPTFNQSHRLNILIYLWGVRAGLCLYALSSVPREKP